MNMDGAQIGGILCKDTSNADSKHQSRLSSAATAMISKVGSSELRAKTYGITAPRSQSMPPSQHPQPASPASILHGTCPSPNPNTPALPFPPRVQRAVRPAAACSAAPVRPRGSQHAQRRAPPAPRQSPPAHPCAVPQPQPGHSRGRTGHRTARRCAPWPAHDHK